MKKTILSLALALMLFVSIGLAASAAETPPAPIDASTIVQLDDMTAPEVPQEDAPAVPGEAPAQPEQEEAPTDAEAPAPDSGNTPYMIGAAVAVLVFIGVALYCKNNGNKIR